MFFAPLEQFQILSILNLKILKLDFSLTNFLLINVLAILIMILVIFLNSYFSLQIRSFYFIANCWQKIIEMLPIVVSKLISDIITKKNHTYLPFILLIFNFILLSNLIGLIPYTFTVTSHLFVTFFLSFSIFFGINLITIKTYGFQFFSLFLPSNTSFFLSLILVPIEFVSYLAKPISLGVRLFINLMAGHTLIKVIAGFSCSMVFLENYISFGSILPMLTLIILFGLELGVALIQTYVFVILICIYLQDGS
jgi:ATP synthase subunit 6